MSQENVPENRMRSRTESLLHRAFLTAKGRSDGFEFAWDHRNNLTTIKVEIEEQLELFVDLQAGPLATGTGPRLYKDAYVIALQEALNILQKEEDL